MHEQGAESIHSQFNSLRFTYKTIADPVERLRCVMKEHYLKVSPKIKSVIPPKPKRRSIPSNLHDMELQTFISLYKFLHGAGHNIQY